MTTEITTTAAPIPASSAAAAVAGPAFDPATAAVAGPAFDPATAPASSVPTPPTDPAFEPATAAVAGAPDAAAKQAARAQVTSAAATRAARSSRSGPSPSRIIAAAASVAAGVGLVGLMAARQPEIVLQVNPTPVTVQPASVVVEMPAGTTTTAAPSIRVVEAAVPVQQEAPQARALPVARSQGS